MTHKQDSPLHRTMVLFGVQGSGKDTVADILCSRYPAVKTGFADPIKAMLKIAFPAFRDEDLNGPSSKRNTQYTEYPFTGPCLECGGHVDFEYTDLPEGIGACETCEAQYPQYVSPRIGAQTLGTQWGRRLYKHLWVDLTLHNIQCADGAELVVVKDGRFHTEKQRITQRGCYSVLLMRGLQASKDAHASEAELREMDPDTFDFVIPNEACSLNELPALVDTMMLHYAEWYARRTR